MQKRSLIMLSLLVFLCLAVVIAQENKIEVSTTKDNFQAGENITLRVSLYNSENNPIDAEVSVLIEDAEKRTRIEKSVPSNKLVDISLGENARYGYWKISVRYGGAEAVGLFFVEAKELARLELNGDVFTITNIGNTDIRKLCR
jgi:uncharacterized protein (DUF58 family)